MSGGETDPEIPIASGDQPIPRHWVVYGIKRKTLPNNNSSMGVNEAHEEKSFSIGANVRVQRALF
jgi:hypothetical protein